MARPQTKAEPQELVHMFVPGVVGSTGTPLAAHHDYLMPRRMAHNRYSRGHAMPAAEVYLTRLKALGVTGVALGEDAAPEVRAAAKKLGLRVTRLK